MQVACRKGAAAAISAWFKAEYERMLGLAGFLPSHVGTWLSLSAWQSCCSEVTNGSQAAHKQLCCCTVNMLQSVEKYPLPRLDSYHSQLGPTSDYLMQAWERIQLHKDLLQGRERAQALQGADSASAAALGLTQVSKRVHSPLLPSAWD